MNSTRRIHHRRAWAGALLAGGITATLWVAAAEPAPRALGDEWETTNQMSMDGMPMQMPVQKMTVCVARDRNEPPGSSRQGCTNTNFKRLGNKVTWNVQCTAPSPMTGTGEIVYQGSDTYSGLIRFLSEHGGMTIKLSGRKLGTSCNNPT